MTYLVTGGAGFIGSHVVDALLARGERVVAFDNFNDYYTPDRKHRHLVAAHSNPNFTLVAGDIRDTEALAHLFATHKPTHVAHLAAMAGPRYTRCCTKKSMCVVPCTSLIWRAAMPSKD